MTNETTDLRLTLQRNGFHPIPVEGKAPRMKGWDQKFHVSEDEIRRWPQTNTGVLARNAPGLDIDVKIEAAAKAAEDKAREYLEEHGNIYLRFGLAPKRLIPLRTNEPFRKLYREFTAPDGSKHRIEFLGKGQQYVVHGVHPETQKPYAWYGGDLESIKREDLPYIRREDAERLLDAMTKVLIEDHDFTLVNGKGKNKETTRKQTNGKCDEARIIAALRYVPADDQDIWVEMGMAIKSELGEDGRSIWDDWSKTSSKFESRDQDKRWNAFGRNGRSGITIATLFYRAQQNGWSADEPARDDPKPEPAAVAPARTLDEVDDTFRKWLGDEYDIGTLHAVLAVTASEKLLGDPAWLLIISGPGNAKTETAQSTSGIGAHIISTIASEGALLSATAHKDRKKTATGGLLRKIGDRGILVVKDVGSILSADRNTRAAVLAALREIYDGRWVRNVGSDGGQTLEWTGRIVVIGACTTAWDQAHAVVSILGDRFVLVRSDSSTGRTGAGRRALRNTGAETSMRQELADAIAGLIGNVNPTEDYDITDEEEERILEAADIVTLARTGVELDYRGNVIDAHAPEMPTRFAKQLKMIMRGALAIGMTREEALGLVIRCARDSMPPLRLEILEDVKLNPDTRVKDVRSRLQRPWSTIDRQLQSLQMLGLLLCREEEAEIGGKLCTIRHYSLAGGVNLGAIASPEM